MALSAAQSKKLQHELKTAEIKKSTMTVRGSKRFCAIAYGVTVKPNGFKGKGSGLMPLGCFSSQADRDQRIADAQSGKYVVGSGAKRKARKRAKGRAK